MPGNLCTGLGKMDWTPERRFYAVLCRQRPDRVPTLTKIWVGPASRLTGTEFRRVIEDPRLAMRIAIEAAVESAMAAPHPEPEDTLKGLFV